MGKYFFLISFLLFFSPLLSFGQCGVYKDYSPTFEFVVPKGVAVLSVKVIINNYEHGEGHRRSRLVTTDGLKSGYFNEDGEIEILEKPTSGSGTHKIKIESGIDTRCGIIGEYVKFSWQVNIVAVGSKGILLDYSGTFSDEYNGPEKLGNVYDGTNIVAGTIDNKLVGEGYLAYPDEDGDGYGSARAEPVYICDNYCIYYSLNNLDCEDYNSEINPDQTEIPHNDFDDDCNPETLDDDLDKDGFSSYIDCDDNNPKINPGQFEIEYNGLDDDCDPNTLDDDLDEDGFIAAEDCDDTNPNINPNQAEIRDNGIDDDCNPNTTDNDLDGDGFITAEDCDDSNAYVNSDQTEIPYNGLDDDCDPNTLDDDFDEDGFIAANDCDDTNPNINPEQTEIPYNGIDDDCNPETLDDDLDEDGFLKTDDCDDENPGINPNQIDIPNNGIDEDCDGSDLIVTSLEDSSHPIKLFPNPTARFIEIGWENGGTYLIELFDATGKLVLSTANSNRVDLIGLSNGTYIIKIHKAFGKPLVKKVIVEK